MAFKIAVLSCLAYAGIGQYCFCHMLNLNIKFTGFQPLHRAVLLTVMH